MQREQWVQTLDEEVEGFATYLMLGIRPFSVANEFASRYHHVNQVIEASDEELLAIAGIGPVRLAQIRKIFEGGPAPGDPTASAIYRWAIKGGAMSRQRQHLAAQSYQASMMGPNNQASGTV